MGFLCGSFSCRPPPPLFLILFFLSSPFSLRGREVSKGIALGEGRFAEVSARSVVRDGACRCPPQRSSAVQPRRAGAAGGSGAATAPAAFAELRAA